MLGAFKLNSLSRVLPSTWNISTCIYDNVSFSMSGQDSNIQDMVFRPDGSRMYATGNGNDKIYQFSLTTPWVISTASYDNKALTVTSQDNTPVHSIFKPDGTKVYFIGITTDQIHQYAMSTAWDISTATFEKSSPSTTSQEGLPYSLGFKSDGTKAYIMGSGNDRISQYSLSTAWDVSTLSYDNVYFYVGTQDGFPQGLHFREDGLKFWVAGSTNSTIYQYSMSTAWNISTASYDNISYNSSTQTSNQNRSIIVRPDGIKAYIVGGLTSALYQYSMS